MEDRDKDEEGDGPYRDDGQHHVNGGPHAPPIEGAFIKEKDCRLHAGNGDDVEDEMREEVLPEC